MRTRFAVPAGAWIDYVQARGFRVEANNVSDSQLNVIAIQSGVPAGLQSRQTAKVGGYIVEGHVPAEDIHPMLKEKPAIVGISVAGMPMGSPGMEQGGLKQPFSTVAFSKDGKRPSSQGTDGRTAVWRLVFDAR